MATTAAPLTGNDVGAAPESGLDVDSESSVVLPASASSVPSGESSPVEVGSGSSIVSVPQWSRMSLTHFFSSAASPALFSLHWLKDSRQAKEKRDWS